MLLQPCPPKVTVEDHIAEAPVNPGGDMDPIGYVVNGNLFQRKSRPELLPHLSADLSMLLAHSIVVFRGAKGKSGHVKAIGPAWILPQAEELLSG